jgi:hypothetical protein
MVLLLVTKVHSPLVGWGLAGIGAKRNVRLKILSKKGKNHAEWVSCSSLDHSYRLRFDGGDVLPWCRKPSDHLGGATRDRFAMANGEARADG